MIKGKKEITRRELLQLGAGAAGMVLISGLGCSPSSSSDEDTGRSSYNVFSEGQIGNLQLKNRLIRSSTWESAASNGEVTDAYIDIQRTLAQGGVAMILSGFMAPMIADAMPTQIQVWDDKFIEGLSTVADAVHATDSECKIVAQIGHAGYTVDASETHWPWTGGAAVPSTEEVEEIITHFAEAIRRVQQAGWDGAELHGAHGYLLSEFLSSYTNTRTDKFGGSVENRVRVIKDIMDQARELVGNDFLIQIKVNANDMVPGGNDIDNFPELAAEIEMTGVDAIHISGNNCLTQDLDAPEKQSVFLPHAEALDVNVPIIITCGNRSIELMEEIIKEGKVDFFGLSRPLVREPDLPARWLEGTGDAESTCINCNGCFDKIMTDPDDPLSCTQDA